MYTFVDRPVDCLCNSGRFLLWAMRSWTRALERDCCPPRALAGSFAGVGALAMLPDFHMAMAMFNRDDLEKITIASIEYPHVVEHEAVLVGVWRDVAKADFVRMQGTLALLVEEDAVAPIARAMSAAAARLVAAGFDLSELSTETLKEVK